MPATTAITRVIPILLLAACASVGGPPGATPAPSDAARPRASLRGPITAADIALVNASSAYDAIVKLRANFLGNRGINSFMQPVRSTRPIVFVDGMEMGTLFELRSIPAADVLEIAFLSSSEATFRYGDGYMAGVINVTTKR